jgi:hypothetical protein
VVECQLPKLDVAGSIPVSRSIFSETYISDLIAGQHKVSTRKLPTTLCVDLKPLATQPCVFSDFCDQFINRNRHSAVLCISDHERQMCLIAADSGGL